jgi:NB-ARC domain
MLILAVYGLGGAGKSQLVLNYIREYRQDYSAVFWIEAGSKESIERDYVQIYRLLYNRPIGAGQEMLKVEDAVPAVKSWFHGREGQWLVVLDSADTINHDHDRSYLNLEYFIPDAPGLHVIVTSRSSTVKELSALEAVEVADMEPSEAAELFQKCAKVRRVGQDAKAEVDRIVKELGCLALAITLAGVYVSMTPRLASDIFGYLPEYRQRRKELLRHRAKQAVYRYGDSVLSTWEASFAAIAVQCPAAGRSLSVLAFVNFDDIYMGLFDPRVIHAMHQSESTSSSTQTWRSFIFPDTEWSLYGLESAFGILQTYSLLQWRSDQGSYSMHKLVHAWGQDRLEMHMQRHMSCLALELLADAISDHH